MTGVLKGSVTLITGASSGIGLELARQMAGRVKALVLLARRAERLETLARELEAQHPGLVALALPCDVTDHAAVDAAVAAAEARVGPIDVLVNNAGMGDFGVYDRVSWDKTARMIAVNVTAVAYLTRKLLPGMVERGRGAVLMISSGFGLETLPGFSAYAGTKQFVTGFTEALRLELVGTGVVVTQVCPGPVATEFEANAADFEAPRVPGFLVISAERCARAAVNALERRRAMVVPGVVVRVLLWVGAITPRWIKRFVYGLAAPRLRRMVTERKSA